MRRSQTCDGASVRGLTGQINRSSGGAVRKLTTVCFDAAIGGMPTGWHAALRVGMRAFVSRSYDEREVGTGCVQGSMRQIVPRPVLRMQTEDGAERVQRMMVALMGMSRLDAAEPEAAHCHRSHCHRGHCLTVMTSWPNGARNRAGREDSS
jgi:hypothetical protein